MSRSGVVIAHADEMPRDGNWTLVRRALDCRSFGLNLVTIPAGGSIPEHDELDRDQEEVFFVVSGRPTLVVDGDHQAAPAGTFARIDPRHQRTLRNDGSEPASVLIMSAPRTSGYAPMSWA